MLTMDTLKVAIFHALTGPAGVDMPGDRANEVAEAVMKKLALESEEL